MTAHPVPLSVTEEQLFAVIGRLYVENLVLRTRLVELEAELRGRADGRGPASAEAPSPAPTDAGSLPHV
jgi:hypothetical protein